jgi:hypothetical protein
MDAENVDRLYLEPSCLDLVDDPAEGARGVGTGEDVLGKIISFRPDHLAATGGMEPTLFMKRPLHNVPVGTLSMRPL